jgi:hypothetical protein
MDQRLGGDSSIVLKFVDDGLVLLDGGVEIAVDDFLFLRLFQHYLCRITLLSVNRRDCDKERQGCACESSS